MISNLRSLRMPSLITGVLTSVCSAGFMATATAQDQSAELTIVVAQVRIQGFRCPNPSSAERLAAESAANQAAYLLKCEGVTYKVVLMPHQAARITEAK